MLKKLFKLLLFILAAILAGLLVAQPAIAEAPQSNSSIINPPYGPVYQKADSLSTNTNQVQPKGKSFNPSGGSGYSGRHSTRAEKQISEEMLRQWLQSNNSPLAPYAGRILQSPFWSSIIGICTIEQYGCTKAPGNNYWGIMTGKGRLAKYATLSDGIEAISSLLSKYESKGKDTIEELNGYYVVPKSANWLNTVIHTKQELESLP